MVTVPDLRKLMRLFILLTFGSAGTLLYAQTIEIKLINGRNGHPIANTCVNVWVGGERKYPMAIPADRNGSVRLRLTENDAEVNTHERWNGCGDFGVINPIVKYKDFIKINVGYVVCEPHGTNFSWLEVKKFPTKQILAEGIATANTCGKAIVSPRPGELVIFVRPLSFWERLKQ